MHHELLECREYSFAYSANPAGLGAGGRRMTREGRMIKMKVRVFALDGTVNVVDTFFAGDSISSTGSTRTLGGALMEVTER